MKRKLFKVARAFRIDSKHTFLERCSLFCKMFSTKPDTLYYFLSSNFSMLTQNIKSMVSSFRVKRNCIWKDLSKSIYLKYRKPLKACKIEKSNWKTKTSVYKQVFYSTTKVNIAKTLLRLLNPDIIYVSSIFQMFKTFQSCRTSLSMNAKSRL